MSTLLEDLNATGACTLPIGITLCFTVCFMSYTVNKETGFGFLNCAKKSIKKKHFIVTLLGDILEEGICYAAQNRNILSEAYS